MCLLFVHREDMYSQDSIDLLQNSGLQFKKHEEEGIDTLYFAELLMTSGLVLCENVKWLSFHRWVDCSDRDPSSQDHCESHSFLMLIHLFTSREIWYLSTSVTFLDPECYQFWFMLSISQNLVLKGTLLKQME